MVRPMSNILSHVFLLFKYERWWVPLGMASLMNLIPFVGGIVVHGWVLELQELRDSGDCETLPELSFDRFADLLKKGLEPTLAAILLALPAVFIAQILMTMVIVAVIIFSVALSALMAAMLGEAGGLLGVVVMLGLMLVMSLMSFVVMVVLGGFIQVGVLRAEITGKLGAVFNFSAYRKDLAALVRPLIMANIGLSLVNIPVMMLGYMMFFVGVFPALVIMSVAGTSMRHEIYRHHLSMGGHEITA